MCGLESGYNTQSLADTYLQLHGNVLNMDHLLPNHLLQRNVRSFIDIIHSNITEIRFSQLSSSLKPYIEDMFPNINVASIYFIIMNTSGYVSYTYDFGVNLKLVFSRDKLRVLDWILPLGALFNQDFLDLLDGGTVIEEMNITVIGSTVGKRPNNFKIYANCTIFDWEFWSIMELTPDVLINAFTRFIGFFSSRCSLAHRQGLKLIGIHCVTPVLYLNCQYIQVLFETFYKSSFYNITQGFGLVDNCRSDTISSATHVHLPGYSNNIVLLIISGNHLGINQPFKTLYLQSSLVYSGKDERLLKFVQIDHCTHT